MSLPSDPSPNLAGPTPPSSTSVIPPLCFPSPTSVAHVVNASAKALDSTSNSHSVAGKDPSSPRQSSQFEHSHVFQHNSVPKAGLERPHSPVEAKSEQPSPCVSHDPIADQLHQQQQQQQQPSSLQKQQSVKIATPDYYYHRPELSNPLPSPPLDRVNKATFTAALEEFTTTYAPPNNNLSDEQLAHRMRVLLDHLDALIEQLALRVTNALFDVLAHPTCLRLLLFLLSDISAYSSPVMTDVRRSYRYPYLVANILANGSSAIRDAFVGSPSLVTHLLSFLDGHVVLSIANSQNGEPSESGEVQAARQMYARNNPIIVGNVVQIVVSYLETSPEPLLQAISARPSFLPSLVNLLHVGSVPKLFSSLILERCVDDVCMMDVKNVTFDGLMSSALRILSNSAIFHLLAHQFVACTQSIYTLLHDENVTGVNQAELHAAQEQAFNILQVYNALVNKTIRCVRLQPNSTLCSYLHVFANLETAKTVVQILRAGTELFRASKKEEVALLNMGLRFVIDLLKCVEQDRERRVASVTGQPPPLDMSAVEMELDPVLQSLMCVLIDIVGTGVKHGETRLRIMELFVEVERTCSENVMGTLNKVRFGQVALKVMMLNPRHSLVHHVICRGVESALIYDDKEEVVRHWIVRSKLMQRIMLAWIEMNGEDKWKDATHVEIWPLLSALVHMGCCIVHWIAMTREGKRMNAEEMVGKQVVEEFEAFFEAKFAPIMEEEKSVLGGAKPRRRAARMSGGSLGRSFGSFGQTQGGMLKRIGSIGGTSSRAHLVRSASAHRFGYVAPVSTARSRFDDMFMEEGGGFASGGSSGASSFASIFDVEPGSSL